MSRGGALAAAALVAICYARGLSVLVGVLLLLPLAFISRIEHL